MPSQISARRLLVAAVALAASSGCSNLVRKSMGLPPLAGRSVEFTNETAVPICQVEQVEDVTNEVSGAKERRGNPLLHGGEQVAARGGQSKVEVTFHDSPVSVRFVACDKTVLSEEAVAKVSDSEAMRVVIK